MILHALFENMNVADVKRTPSPEEINEWLKQVDWEKFWNDVTENCREETDAYHRASAASYAKAHEHWFV